MPELVPGHARLDRHADGGAGVEEREAEAVGARARAIARGLRVHGVGAVADRGTVVDPHRKLRAVEEGRDIEAHRLEGPKAAVAVMVGIDRCEIVGVESEVERDARRLGGDRRCRRADADEADELALQLLARARSGRCRRIEAVEVDPRPQRV